MTVNPCYFQKRFSQPFPLDKSSMVKTWVCDAADLFMQFCTSESTWRYLEKDQSNLWPHLKKINAFCISTKESLLSESYLKSISAILRVDPSLIELCVNTTQDVKDFQATLLKTHCDIIYKIAENHLQGLLETHFQAIQKIHKLRPIFLKAYLKIIGKYSLNNVDNLLTHHICGIYTSLNTLKKDATLKKLFFQEVDNIWNSRPNLLEFYLQNVYMVCNFFNPPTVIGRYLIASSRIFNLQTSIFETHLSNLNSIPLPFLKDYINITFHLKNNPQMLELYIESVCILKKKFSLIRTHQQNTKAICELQFPILEIYFTLIAHLAENTISRALKK